MEKINLINENSKSPLQIQAGDLIDFGVYLIETTLKKSSANDEFLTVAETMNLLSLKSRVTLWRWQQKNILTPIKIEKGLRYKKNDVVTFLNGGGNEL
jgi:hypothetical protein